jgi:hypothetical protein
MGARPRTIVDSLRGRQGTHRYPPRRDVGHLVRPGRQVHVCGSGDRWQKFWPGAGESDLAGWLAARQLFAALIVTAATLLANRSVVVPGTSIQFKNGFVLGAAPGRPGPALGRAWWLPRWRLGWYARSGQR